MAELSSKALANFSAATSALILTESLRLVRNYKYYNNKAEDTVSRNQLLRNIRNARKLAFTLQNLMSKNESEESPFYVSISGVINDLLEEIHRKILFYDADLIVEIIPIIDQQRTFWENFHQTEFYSSSLMKKLDHSIPEAFLKIEKKVIGLPPFPSV